MDGGVVAVVSWICPDFPSWIAGVAVVETKILAEVNEFVVVGHLNKVMNFNNCYRTVIENGQGDHLLTNALTQSVHVSPCYGEGFQFMVMHTGLLET